MHWRITPSLVEETAILIQDIEEIEIRLRSQPIKITDFKVGPLITFISRGSLLVLDKENLRNGNDYKTLRHHRSTSPRHCPQEYAPGVIS